MVEGDRTAGSFDSGQIVFLSVPESLRGQIEHTQESSFSIDPAIPLPVEVPEGGFYLEELSWEMILSGMIRVIREDPEGENANYYRQFVLTVRPDILREFSSAAIVKARNGDYGMALEIFAGLEGLFPKNPALLLNQALTLEAQARSRAESLERSGREAEAGEFYEGAQRAWEKVLALRPVLPEGLFNAGFFFMSRRDFEQARDCFSAYLPLADDDEKKEKAEAILRDIEQGGLDDEVLREASSLIRNGKEEEGLPRIREFLERHPGSWNGWFILGWALRKLGRWPEGVASFRQALEFGGDNPDTRNELAICLSETGDLKAARRELETALRKEPENIKIISNLGALALKSGNHDEAAAFFRTVLELDPEDPLAREFLGQG